MAIAALDGVERLVAVSGAQKTARRGQQRTLASAARMRRGTIVNGSRRRRLTWIEELARAALGQ